MRVQRPCAVTAEHLRAVRRAAARSPTTAIAATTSSDPVALPMPSQGSRIALVARASGSGPRSRAAASDITAGGGPPTPSRNDGKKSSSPIACAARADGSSGPEQDADADEGDRADRDPGGDPDRALDVGTPYTGAATASSRRPAIAIAASPIASWARAKDQRGKPDAANRRSTPRSRYDAMCTGSMIRPVAPMTTVK